MEELIHVYQCRSTHVDMERYYTLEKQGLVNIKKHPDYPLYLLNYTPRAQYKRRWCHELIHARGLVISQDGEIVARPLPKFFNHYEIKGELEGDFELYDKMDGSLVIMFYYENNRIFCTRGSFTSNQAAKAQAIFEQKYNHVIVKKECTYCFEVIYPENKIVVDYGNVEDLFLISMTQTQTGKEEVTSQFKTVDKIENFENSIKNLVNYNLPNKEGYVVKYKNGFRLKLKFDNYISKHRSKTLSYNAIKRSMQKMENINLEHVPDECYEEVKQIQRELEEQFKCKKKMCEKEYEDIVKKSKSSRDVIEAIKQSEHSSILFAILRCKSYDLLVWRLL